MGYLPQDKAFTNACDVLVRDRQAEKEGMMRYLVGYLKDGSLIVKVVSKARATKLCKQYHIVNCLPIYSA